MKKILFSIAFAFSINALYAQIPTSNLSLWLRADAGVTTAGNSVTAWADQSGNSNNFTTYNASPILIPNTLNGYNTIRFNGSTQALSRGVSSSLQFSKITFFIVAKSNALQTNGAPFFQIDNNGYGLMTNSASTNNFQFYFSNINTNRVQLSFPVGEFRIGSGTYNLSSITGANNTTTVSPFVYSNAINTSFSTFYLGVWNSWLNGEIAELIMYNNELSLTDYQQVYNYLSAKYNIGIHPNAPQITSIGTQNSYFDSNYNGTRVAASGFGGTGDDVTIVGSNFSSVTGLLLNGISITGFTINSNNLISFTLPDGLNYVGKDFTGSVQLVNSFGSGFSPLPLQVIYSNSAPAGIIDVARNGRFSIEGTDLSQINSISIGGVNASFSYNSATKSISVFISSTTGLGNQNVRVSQGTYIGNQFFDFADPVNVVTSLPSPIITSISPSKGDLGSLISITGNNFAATPSENVVYFGATKAEVVSSNANSILAKAPAGLSYQNISLLNINSNAQTQFNPTYTHTFLGGGVFTNNTFAPEVNLNPSSFYTYFSTIADLNGDGKPEIISSHKYSSARISIFQNNITNTITSASFGSVFYLTTANQIYQIIAKDFDNDGRLDLAVYNYGGGIQIFRNIHTSGALSATSFAAPFTITVPVGGYALDAADIDSDGKIDLAVAAHSVNNTLYVIKNQFIGNTLVGSSFASPVTISFGTGAYPVDLKLVDIDNDGKVDLATANQNNSGNSSLSIFRNITSQGVINASTFATPVTIALTNTFNFSGATDPERLNSLEFADFDGDGKLDIVATNRTLNSISVFRNKTSVGTINGTSFNEKVDFSTGTTPQGLAVGDINGDGKLDIAVASEGEQKLYLFRNQSVVGTISGSSFAPRFDLPSLYQYNTQPHIVDMDGDAKPDLVVSNWGNYHVGIFRNLMDNPASITGFTPSSGLPLSMVTVFGSNFNNVAQVRMGTVTGGTVISRNASQIVIRIPVGANTNQISLLNNSGSAATSSDIFTITGTTPFATITAVSPINASLGGTINIFGTGFDATPNLNNIWFGATKMPVISATPNQLTVSVSGGGSSAKISYQNSYGLNDHWKLPFGYSFAGGNLVNGSFSRNATLNTGSQPYNVISHDLDGDGKPDLIATNYSASSNQLSIYRNNSINNTINGTTFATGFGLSGYTASNSFQSSVGDLDGDGKPEIVLPFYNTGFFTIFKNNSTPSTLTAASFTKNDIQVLPGGYGSYGSAIADIDNDGFNDIIFSSYLSSGIFIYRNLGNGRLDAGGFQFTNFWNTSGNPTKIEITDLDGDGRKDIIVGNTSTTYLSVFRNVSTVGGITAASLATRVDLQTPNTPYGISIADLNSDGKPDIISTNYNTHQISIFQNNISTNTLTAALFTRTDLNDTPFGNPYAVHTGDLDGDGKPEIVTAHQSVLEYAVFKNNYSSGNIGASQFSRIDISNTQYTSGLELADLDLDGKQEVIMANTNANTLFLYKNQIGNGVIPTITGFTPTSGVPLATFVTVSGFGFTSVTGVKLGATVVNNYTVVNANTLIIRVPNTTISGQIGIANQFGTVGNSVDIFTITGVAPLPVISNIIPYSGQVGESILITGTGFDAIATNNTVFFGRVKATVTGANTTSLNVVVPVGASFEYIRVMNNLSQLTGESGRQFTVTFAGPNTITAASFGTRANIIADNNNYHTVFADLDGDGRNDMLATGGNNNRFMYYRNTGTGSNFNSFGARQLIGESFPYKLTVGDFDADGRLDVALTSHNTNFLTIYKNTSSIGAISFASGVQFSTGANPAGVETADFDNDGLLDIAVTNYGTNSISIFRNNGLTGVINTNSFAARQDFVAENSNYNISVGDIDKDGRVDIIAGTQNTNNISVLRNISSLGNISFAPKVSITSQFYPWDVKLVDFDRDGKLDIVSTHPNYSIMSIFRNVSSVGTITASSFSTRVDYNTSVSPYGLGLTDIDGDGKVDIAVTHTSVPYNVSFFRNLSTVGGISAASLAPRVDIPLTNGQGYYPGFGDMDGDGKDDFGTNVLSNAQIGLFRNQSAPAPSITGISPLAGTPYTTFVTITGAELSAVSSISIGGGSGVVSSKTNTQLIARVPSSASTGVITLTNVFNATGVSVDIFTVTGLSPLPVITSVSPINVSSLDVITLSGNGFGTTLGQNVAYLGSERVNILSQTNNQVLVQNTIGTNNSSISIINTVVGLQGIANQYINNTFTGPNTIVGASFAAFVTTATSSNSFVNQIADIDGDGRNDMITANYGTNTVSVFRNISSVGGFSFAARQDFTVGSNPFGLVVADFDNDGKKDIAVGNYSSSSISLLRNLSSVGTISFATIVNIAVSGLSPYGFMSAGDLDGDGFLDLAFSCYYNATVGLLKNAGNVGTITATSFGNRIDITGISNPHDVQISDLDNDGKNDLLYVYPNQLIIRKNVGVTGQFDANMLSSIISYGTSSSPTKIIIRDLDRDGRNDIIVGNQGTNVFNVYKNNTSGNTITGSSFTSFSLNSLFYPFALVSADIDGDGRLDLVHSSTNSAQIGIHRNISTVGGLSVASFAPMVNFNSQNVLYGISEGDLDGDGKTDIVASNYNNNTLNLFRNLSPAPPTITGISPLTGTAGIDIVSVLGIGFTGLTTVGIAGANTPNYTVVGSNLILVKVPISATSGPVVIRNLFNITVTSIDIFTVTGAFPLVTITSVVPLKAANGETLVINGNNFDTLLGNNLVYFGNTPTTPFLASATQLSVNVPLNATYQEPRVVNRANNLLADFGMPFTQTFTGLSTITGATFANPVNATAVNNPYHVAIGDIDGDGKPDAVSSSYLNGVVSIYRNVSNSGTWTGSSLATRVDINVGGYYLFDVKIADFDNDGKLDILVASNNSAQVFVLKNNCTVGNITAGSFSQVTYNLSGSPYGLAVADFDNDGKLDFATGNHSTNTISIYRNNGVVGTITAASFTKTPNDITGVGNIYELETADINYDGKIDLISANYNSNSFSLIQNISSPENIQFRAPINYSESSQPIGLRAGDIDNDGRLDLVFTGYGGSVNVAYRNLISVSGASFTGSSFGNRTTFAANTWPYGLDMGDLDGDGNVDMVSANYNSSNISIYRNRGLLSTIGGSSFSSKVDEGMPSNCSYPKIADMDLDGYPDIVVPIYGSSQISVLRLNLNSTPTATGFNPSSGTPLSVISISGIGLNTVNQVMIAGVVSPNITVLGSTGVLAMIPFSAVTGNVVVANAQGATSTASGIFTVVPIQFPTITGISPNSVSQGGSLIIDGQNFSTITGNNLVFMGAVQANVSATTPTQLTVDVPQSASYEPISYLNIDSKFRANYSIPANLAFAGSGTIVGNSFASAVNYSGLSQPYFSFQKDLNNDGKPEIIIANYGSNYITVFVNNASGNTITGSSFTSFNIFPGFNNQLHVTAEDVDNDGRPDLVLVDYLSNRVGVMKNNYLSGVLSVTDFASPVFFNTGNRPYTVAVADIDFDGFNDLITANGNANSVSILKNNITPNVINASSFAAKQDFAIGSSPSEIGVADLDGDGRLDIVTSNQSTQSISILKNTATRGIINASSMATVVNYTTPYNGFGLGFGDLNNDGKTEILCASSSNAFVMIYQNNTTGNTITGTSFSRVDIAAPIYGYRNAKVADFDGDGKNDFAVPTSFTQISVYRNVSTGVGLNTSSFAVGVPFTTQSYPWGLSVGDLDGDFKPEIVALNNSSASLSIFKNRQSNTNLPTITAFSPASARLGKSFSIVGTNFVGVTTVQLGGLSLPYTVVNSGLITATLTGNYTTGLVTINGFGGAGISSTTFGVAFTPSPSITGITPNPVLQGGVITITGSELEFLTNPITISGLSLSGYQFNLALNRIVATVSGSAVSGDIRVATQYGGISPIQPTSFLNVTPFLLPSISGFNPSAALPNSIVSVLGNNFVSISGISISGVAAQFSITNSSLIIITVPSAITGKATIINYSGQSQSLANLQILTVPAANFGNMVYMDGTNNFIRIQSAGNVFEGSGLTFEAMVKRARISSPNGQDRLIMSESTNGWGVYFENNRLTFGKIGVSEVSSNYVFADTLWHHVAVSHNGTLVKFYIDGNFESQQAYSQTFNSFNGNYSIGSRGASEYFRGRIDEIRIWNVERSVTGIAANRCDEILGNESNLVGYFRFNEPSNSSTALDASARGLHANLLNFTLPAERLVSSAKCYSPATISGFSPNPLIGGVDILTINGLGFSDIVSVRLSSLNLPNFTVSGNTIMVAIPTTVTNSRIAVTNGTVITTSTGILTISGLNPNITAINPASERQGKVITINGLNFSGASTVSFANGVNSTFNIQNSTSIIATVPGGAVTGLLTVTNLAGIGTYPFTVTGTPAPTVTGVTPAFALNGTSITATLDEIEFFQGPVTIGGTTISAFTISGNTLSFVVPLAAITGHVRIKTLYGGISPTLTGSLLTILPPPTITDFGNMVTGLKQANGGCGVAAGDLVTIIGNNFAPGQTDVTFNNFNSINPTVTSTNLIIARVPDISGFPGQDITGKIRITTPAGNILSAQNLTGLFCTATPTTTLGIKSSGSFEVTGNDLVYITAASVAGISATFNYNIGLQKLTVNVPSNVPTGMVSVTLAQGAYLKPFAFSFYVFPKPTVTGFSPNPVFAGNMLSIVGTALTSSTGVIFTGATNTVVSNVNDNLVVVQVPLNAQNGFITLQAFGGNSVSTVQLSIAPTVTGISPVAGGVGRLVSLTGNSLNGVTQVFFNGVQAAINSKTNSRVLVNVPSGATSGNVWVQSLNYTSPGIYFTVVPPPVISNIIPASAPAGAIISIVGSNYTLSGVNTASFNGTGSSVGTVVGDNLLLVEVPVTASTGFITVTNEGGSTTSNIQFVPSPLISGIFSPSVTGSGGIVQIFGSNLLNPSLIRFNGQASSGFTSISATRVDATIPLIAAGGVVTVQVTTEGGTSNIATYTVVGVPTVSSSTPLTGAYGDVITITGTRFRQEGNVVRINGVNAESQFVSSGMLLATVPGNVFVAVGQIQVQNLGNQFLNAPANFANSPTSFTVKPTLLLVKDDCNNQIQTQGIWGELLKVQGYNILSGAQVSFNGEVANAESGTWHCFGSYTYLSSYEMFVRVPSGATTGNIFIQTLGGQSNTLPFTIIPPPVVTSFSPASGLAGTIVSVIGTGFDTVTGVRFGSLSAPFTVINSQLILTTVLGNAVKDKISVTAFGGSNSSTLDFTPIPTITGVNHLEAPIGSEIILSGTNLYSPTNISFNGSSNANSYNNNTTNISITVPTNASNGVISFTNAGGTALSPFSFVVSTITGMSTTTGVAGTLITISGTGITSAQYFKFDATPFLPILSTGTGFVVVSVPGTAEQGKIALSFPNGGITSTTGIFNPTPVISSVSPNTHGTSQLVNILGTNLREVIAASFNGVLSSNLGFANGSNRNSVQVPTQALSGIITLTVAGGGVASSPLTFTVISISGLSPAITLGGTEITISGANLDNPDYVTIGGTTVAGINPASNFSRIITTVPSNISSAQIIVGKGGGFNDSFFLNLPDASITGINPTFGAANTVITISGNNFTNARNVFIHNATHSPFNYPIPYEVVSVNRIIATVVGTAITGNIRVTGQNNNTANGAIFTLPPVLSSLPNPAVLPAGQSVVINGFNLTSPTTLTVGGVAVSVTNYGANSLTFTVPTIVGNNILAVGNIAGVSTVNFGLLSITNISTTLGVAGTAVTLTGTSLASISGIRFNGVNATFISVNNTTAVANVPVNAGNGQISVIAGTYQVSFNQTFTPVPVITGYVVYANAIDPQTARAGSVVSLSGTNLNNVNNVRFGSSSNTYDTNPFMNPCFTGNNSTSLAPLCIPSNASSGIITASNGLFTASFAGFSFVGQPGAISTVAGVPGTQVTILGSALNTVTAVSFGGIPASGFTQLSATQVVATIPLNATISGSVSFITLGGNTSNTYIAPPIITSLSKTQGAVGIGLQINGLNFTRNSASFNGVTGTGSSFGSSFIVINVPVGATTGLVSVSNEAGTASSAALFNVLPMPTITGFTPGNGEGGTTVIINGVNLDLITGVTFGTGAQIATFTGISSTQIQAIAPPNVLTGKIGVSNPDIYPVTIYSTNDYIGSPVFSSVINLSNNNASYIGTVGDLIQINGSNFTNPSNVLFNGVTASSVSFINSGQLTAVVPIGASSGLITVSTPGGNLSTPQAFSVVSITSVIPVVTNSCSGSAFSVLYTITGLFPADNIFTVDLMNGGTVVQSSIGTRNSAVSGSVNAIIPSVSAGNYQVRLRSNSASTNYQFITANSSNINITNINNWLGITDDWNNTNNWGCLRLPNSTSFVTIPVTANNPVIYGSATTGILEIQSGATISLTSSGILTLHGNVSIPGTSAFQMADNSYVFVNDRISFHSPDQIQVGNITINNTKQLTLYTPMKVKGSLVNFSNSNWWAYSYYYQGLHTNSYPVTVEGSVFQAIGTPNVGTYFDELILNNNTSGAGVALGGPVYVRCKLINYGIFDANGFLTEFVNGPCSTPEIIATTPETNFQNIVFSNTVTAVNIAAKIRVRGNLTNAVGAKGISMSSVAGMAFVGTTEPQIIESNGQVLDYQDFTVNNPLGVILSTVTSTPIRVRGNLVNNGKFIDRTNTISLTGTNTTISGAGEFILNNIETSSSSTLTIKSSIRVRGNLKINGAVNPAKSTISFTSSFPQTVSGASVISLAGIVISDSSNVQSLSNLAISGNVSNSGAVTVVGLNFIKDSIQHISGEGSYQIGTVSNQNTQGLIIESAVAVSGNFVNNGLMSVVGVSTSFTGTNQTISGTSIANLETVDIAPSSQVTISQNVRVRGNLKVKGNINPTNTEINFAAPSGQTIESDHSVNLASIKVETGTQVVSSAALIVSGSVQNEGMFTASNALTFNGISGQSISGSGMIKTTDLVQNSVSTVQISQQLEITGNLVTNSSFVSSSQITFSGANQVISGSSQPVLNNIEIAPSASLSVNTGVRVRGNLKNNSAANGMVATAPVKLEGSSLQTIEGNKPTQFAELIQANPVGVNASSAISVSGITLAGGNLTVAGTLVVTSSDTAAVTKSTDGYVVGAMSRAITNPQGNYQFPIGTADSYRGANVNFATSASGSGSLLVSHANVAPSFPSGNTPAFDTTLTAQGIETVLPLSWTIEPSTSLAGANYDVTLQAAIPNTFGDVSGLSLVKRHTASDSWTQPGTTGSSNFDTNTGTLTVKRRGIRSFSEYAIAGTCANLSNGSTLKPVITVVGAEIRALTSGSQYEWSRDGVVQRTLTGANITPTRSGTYRLRMRVNGCFSGTSDPVEFTVPSVPGVLITVPSALSSSLQNAEISLYPNPASSQVTLNIENSKSGVYVVQVFDLIGKPLIKQIVNAETKTSFKEMIDISTLSQGLYFVKITLGKETKVLKLLVE
jgi:hypothetical protein